MQLVRILQRTDSAAEARYHNTYLANRIGRVMNRLNGEVQVKFTDWPVDVYIKAEYTETANINMPGLAVATKVDDEPLLIDTLIDELVAEKVREL